MNDSALGSSEHPPREWTSGSRRFVLYANSEVIRRLWMTFKQAPRRELEIGGILLGRADAAGNVVTLRVEGFQAIDSEHGFGPSYLLSEADYKSLKDELRRNGASSLGIFRSQTRSEHLSLDKSDVEMFHRCFEGSDALFLMLGSMPGRAAVFAPVDGELKCVHEFVLASSLASVHGSQAESASPRARESAEQRSPALRLKGRLIPWGRDRVWVISASIALLALGMIVGTLFHRFKGALPPRQQAAELLPLSVQPAAGSLRLSWDPNSLPLHGAALAVLHIQDGDLQVDRSLDSVELRTGRIEYEPKSTEVSFRVDVYSAQPSATGFLQVVNYPARAAASQSAPVLSPDGAAHAIAPVRPSSYDKEASAAKDLKEDTEEDAVEKKETPEGWLGVSVQSLPWDLANAEQFTGGDGVLVTAVEPGSPAAVSGLKKGDIVLAIDGQLIDNPQALQSKIRRSPGRSVRVTVASDNQKRQVIVNLGESLASAHAGGAAIAQASRGRGITAGPLTPAILQQLRLPGGTKGVVVTHVDSNSPAYEAVLQNGDVIQEVDRQPVSGLAAFDGAMQAAAGRAVLLSIERDQGRTFVAVPANVAAREN